MTEQSKEFKTFTIEKPLLGKTFLVQVPPDWNEMPMTDDKIDFDNSNLFQPLVVFGPAYVASAFTVMARPKFAKGTLDEWLVMLCKEQGITIKQQGKTTLGAAPVAVALGIQTTEAGLFGLYIALFEDGGVLYALVIMCPEKLWDAMSETMEQIVRGFRLIDPSGTTIPPKQEKKSFSYTDFALAEDQESFRLKMSSIFSMTSSAKNRFRLYMMSMQRTRTR